MRSGDRGWDVAALQFLLQRAGHGPGRADGVFGPLTAARWSAGAGGERESASTGSPVRRRSESLRVEPAATTAQERRAARSASCDPSRARSAIAVRRPASDHPTRRRLPGAIRHPDRRRRRRDDDLRRLQLWRLRQSRRDPAPARLHHLVRPPVHDHDLGRRSRSSAGPGSGTSDRPATRPAPTSTSRSATTTRRSTRCRCCCRPSPRARPTRSDAWGSEECVGDPHPTRTPPPGSDWIAGERLCR